MPRRFLSWLGSEVFRGERLGMAMPGPGLPQRVHTILDGVRSARVSRARLICIGLAIAVLGAVVTTARLAHAQQPLPTFEVASVKPAATGANGRFLRLGTPGRLSVTNFTLQDLIQWAYGPNEMPLEGGPKWMNETSFDIEAQGPVSATAQQLRLMLRALLAERFALKIHTDRKETPAYALVAVRNDGKLGPKVVNTTGKACEGRAAPPDPAMPRCGAQISPLGMAIKGGTMAHLANMLSLPLTDFGRPVVDHTGIAGDFDFNLEFSFRMPNAPVAAGNEGPSIFTAIQEQLGLKLENARASVDTLVVDSAEKPGEN
jgi:uncharacterized protein (TIGR03435 family)